MHNLVSSVTPGKHSFFYVLIDINDIAHRNRMRAKCAREIIETERSYTQQLLTFLRVCVRAQLEFSICYLDVSITGIL